MGRGSGAEKPVGRLILGGTQRTVLEGRQVRGCCGGPRGTPQREKRRGDKMCRGKAVTWATLGKGSRSKEPHRLSAAPEAGVAYQAGKFVSRGHGLRPKATGGGGAPKEGLRGRVNASLPIS